MNAMTAILKLLDSLQNYRDARVELYRGQDERDYFVSTRLRRDNRVYGAQFSFTKDIAPNELSDAIQEMGITLKRELEERQNATPTAISEGR